MKTAMNQVLLAGALLALAGATPLFAAETRGPQQPAREPSSGKELVAERAAATYDIAADERRKAAMSPEEAAWKKTIEQSLFPFYLAKYKREKLAGQTTPWAYVKDDPKLPRILLIGDSISKRPDTNCWAAR